MATQIGTVIDGKYEILKQIGKGGMSIVYLAMDKRLNKQWAVKEISRKGFGKNNEEIVNEVPADAEMMKRLDHPAIPRIVDIIDRKDSEYIYVVMDYVEGESLDKVLAEYGAQPQELVIDWAKQICDALGYLHSQKPPIIYRDMKPANIMLKPEGNVKIIDFGIAREYKEGNLADTTVLGTKGYASPEHYGGRQTDERSDIYTLGMTMHHLLTGVDPRPADYIYAPIRQWNPELSGGLERIIDKCVSPDPKDRYQNCNELLYALDHYTEEEDSFKKKQKRKLISFVGSLSLAVVFGIGGMVTNNMAKAAESNNYDKLIEITNNSYESAIENIDKAIALNRSDIRAYQNFLNYIIADENITKEESQGFSTIFNQLKADKKGNYDEEFAQLSYDAGINHFLRYEIDSEDFSTRDRALKALKYFEDIKDGSFTDSKMAANFYTICDFYKTDNGNSFDVVNYKEEYASVFDSINECIEYLDKNYKGRHPEFVKVSMYKSTIDFIHSNIKEIASPDMGNIEKSVIDSLFNNIKEKTSDIKDAKEDSKINQTKRYILEKIPEYSRQVEEQYKNQSR